MTAPDGARARRIAAVVLLVAAMTFALAPAVEAQRSGGRGGGFGGGGRGSAFHGGAGGGFHGGARGGFQGGRGGFQGGARGGFQGPHGGFDGSKGSFRGDRGWLHRGRGHGGYRGYWHGGRGGRFRGVYVAPGWGLGFGYPYWAWPYPYGYPYAYYPSYPSYTSYTTGAGTYVADVPLTQTYIQRGSSPRRYWYYCPRSEEYYPKVRDCPDDWIRVPPRPPGR